MNVKQILIDARALIAEKHQWTQHALARDTYGNHTGALESAALCWCASGAVIKAAGRAAQFDYVAWNDIMAGIGDANIALRANMNCERPIDLMTFNDTHSHASVLALFDEGIASLGETSQIVGPDEC